MEGEDARTMTEGHQRTVKRLTDFMLKRNLSQHSIARKVEISPQVVSKLIRGAYENDPSSLLRKVDAFLDDQGRFEAINSGLETTEEFVETPTAVRIEGLCTFVKARATIAVLTGRPGVGKSTTLKQMVGDHAPATWYCEMKREDGRTVAGTVSAIAADGFGMYTHAARSRQLTEMICQYLYNKQGMLIIDEAQHLCSDSLEQLRGIYDAVNDLQGTSFGIVLAGHPDLADNVARKEQLDSRVGRHFRISAATVADVNALCDHWGLEDSAARDLFRSHVGGRGALRRVAHVYRLALQLAKAKSVPVTYEHVRKAWQAFSSAN